MKHPDWNRLVLLERWIPYVGAAVYSVVLSYLAILRYESFTDAWDFGGFVQSISDATHGGFFLQTIDAYFAKGFPQTELISFFGLHFSPVLYLLVPIYAVFPYPPTLLVIQTVALGLGVFPVYWLAKKHLGLLAGLVFAVIYLTYAPLIGINLTDFHPESFLVPSLLYAIYFGIERRWVASLPFFALALSVIEESGILIFAVIAFLFVYHRGWRNSKMLVVTIAGCSAALVYTAVTSQLLYYYGLNPAGFTAALNAENYSILGASAALSVPAAILRYPGNIIPALLYQIQYKIAFLTEIIGPLALLPLFYPEALLMAIPWIAISFVSNYAGYYTISGFHQAFIIFFAFPAAILGLKRIKDHSPKITPRVLRGYLAVLLIVALVFSATQSFPSATYGGSFTVTQQNNVEQRFVSLLPANASVLTTSDIFPHLANSINVYTVPPDTLRLGYATTDQQILSHINPEYILLNMASGDGNDVAERNAILAAKVYNGTYGLLAYEDKVMLLQQGFTGKPIIYDNTLVYNATNLSYDTRTTSQGPNDSLIFNKGDNWVNMWFGPYSFIPAGNYSATFTLKISGQVPAKTPVITLDADYANLITVQREVLNGTDFPNSGWQSFTLNFTLAKAVVDLQLRGMYPTNTTTIYLQNILVVPRE